MCNCKKSSSNRVAASPAIVSAPAFASKSVARKRTPRKAIEPVVPASMAEIDGESLDEKRQTFAYMLGMEEPVSEAVLIAAVDYPAYARSLMQSINNPGRLSDLLNNPPYNSDGSKPFSNTALVKKAGVALLKWATSGFPTVSKSTLQKREDACLACRELRASTNTLQKISASSLASNKIGMRTGNKSCAICGCVITNKIRLATETCPRASTADPTINKWGEAMKAD